MNIRGPLQIDLPLCANMSETPLPLRQLADRFALSQFAGMSRKRLSDNAPINLPTRASQSLTLVDRGGPS
jgi:hypothetical protein